MGKTPFGLGSKQFKIVQNCCEQTKTILVPCVSYRMEMLWWNIIGWKHTPICSISKATNQPTCADNPPKKKSLVAPDLAPKTCSQAARATPWRVAHGMAGLWLVWKFGTWFFRYSMFLVWKWHEMTKPGFEVDSYLTNLSLPQMPPSNRMFHIPPFSAEASKLQFFYKNKPETPLRCDYPDDFTSFFCSVMAILAQSCIQCNTTIHRGTPPTSSYRVVAPAAPPPRRRYRSYTARYGGGGATAPPGGGSLKQRGHWAIP